jgi:hypothetical protein
VRPVSSSQTPPWLLHPSGIALLALLLLAWACEFKPVARRAKPEQIAAGSFRLLRSLDPLGIHVLITHEPTAGEQRTAIYAWRTDERCDLPAAIEKIGRPLTRPLRGARSDGALFLPLVLRTEGAPQLVLVDEHCRMRGSYGAVVPDTLRNFVSQEDQRGFLVFRDNEHTLSVLDPWRTEPALAIASGVADVQGAPALGDKKRDALWLLEDGVLTQRSLSGALLVALGEAATAFALKGGDSERVAYVDADAVYEAVGPGFVPVRLASDACSPRYRDRSLDFFSPCAARALMRRNLPGGDVQSFPAGVFTSLLQEDVRLDYVQTDETSVELFAESKQYDRRKVEPVLGFEGVYVLDQQRIAGLSASGVFGSWNGIERQFTGLLDGVDTVLPHFRGKRHEFWWLVHHDVVDGLGSLSVVRENGLEPMQLAAGVPALRSGGFIMDRGAALPKYPYAEPIVVLIADSVPLAADPQRHKGQLRALLLSGELGGDLAENVSSYLLVAAPLAGVLYAVEEGPKRGLWFVAL